MGLYIAVGAVCALVVVVGVVWGLARSQAPCKAVSPNKVAPWPPKIGPRVEEVGYEAVESVLAVSNGDLSAPLQAIGMILRTIARYIALTMATLGALGLLYRASEPTPVVVLVTDLGLLAAGLATVFGLKRRQIRIPAALLNIGIFVLGLCVAIAGRSAEDEIRRILWPIFGAFCVIAGAANAAGLLIPDRPKAAETDPTEPRLCPLAYQALLVFWFPFAGVPMAIVAIRRIRGSKGKMKGEGLAWAAIVLSAIDLAWWMSSLFLR